MTAPETKLTYTNPRAEATFADWPIGGSNRGTCRFWVEKGTRGFRVGRQTTDKHGKLCKPKFTTYGGPCAIVDGDDGRTYLLRHAGIYDHITVSRSDFMDHETVYATEQVRIPGDAIWGNAANLRHAELLALLEETK